jgi:hypothetical protein
MLSFNVSGLLRAAPGTKRTYPVNVDELPLAPELQLVAPVRGEVRLTKTGRSILAAANLDTAIAEQCSRCLTPISSPVHVTFQEEALPSIDLETGQPVDMSEEPDVTTRRRSIRGSPRSQTGGPIAARRSRTENASQNEGVEAADGRSEAPSLTRATGRPSIAPRADAATTRRVSPLPRAEADPPRLRELRLLQRPRGGEDQAPGARGAESALTGRLDRISPHP